MSISTPPMEGHQWEDSSLALLLCIIVIAQKGLLVKTAKRMLADSVTLMLYVNTEDASAKKVILVVVKSAPKRVCANQTIHV